MKNCFFVFIFLFLATKCYCLDLGRTALFGTGVLTGMFIHELSHAAAGIATGGTVNSVSLVNAQVSYPDEVTGNQLNRKVQPMALAGYIGQNVLVEIVLQNNALQSSDFYLGVMWTGIVANVVNVGAFYLFNNKNVDLGIYEKYGGDPLIPAILMTAYSGFALYRIFNDTDIVPYMTHQTFGISWQF